MEADRVAALEALLSETEAAHGTYEATKLEGVYDEAWPRWYAEYAVDHGIGGLLGRPVSVDELERFLTASWTELQKTDPRPTVPWTAYTAGRLAADLS